MSGWLGVLAGPLHYLQGSINTIKELAKKAKKSASKFHTIVLAYPNVTDSDLSGQDHRFPLTGTIEQIGDHIQKIKQMEIDHIFFGFCTYIQ